MDGGQLQSTVSGQHRLFHRREKFCKGMYSGNLLLWQYLCQAFWHLYNPEKQFSLLSPLWKSLAKKPHNKWQQRFLQLRRAWHMLPRFDASLRKRHSVPSLPEKEGVGGLGALDTARSSMWQWPQGDSKRTRDLHGARDSHQRTGQIFRFLLIMTSSCHRPHKTFFSLPLPALDFSAAIR